jgi:outer membrane immunogenic protein
MRFTLLTILVLVALSAALAPATLAQDEMYRGDAAVTYNWVHTNAGPGQCGCFNISGASLTGSWDVAGPWAIVTDFGSEFRGAVPGSQDSLTVTSFLAGARYRLPQIWLKRNRPLLPFAQVLVGPAHAGGGEAGIGDGHYAFATRIGGGIDIPLSHHFEVRAIEADWLRTQFPNGQNDRQNNLQISAGILYRWSHSK